MLSLASISSTISQATLASLLSGPYNLLLFTASSMALELSALSCMWRTMPVLWYDWWHFWGKREGLNPMTVEDARMRTNKALLVVLVDITLIDWRIIVLLVGVHVRVVLFVCLFNDWCWCSWWGSARTRLLAATFIVVSGVSSCWKWRNQNSWAIQLIVGNPSSSKNEWEPQIPKDLTFQTKTTLVTP